MKTWLVTGGAGFIGSHLVEALKTQGDAVRVLDDLSTGKAANLPFGTPLMRGSVTDAALAADAMRGVDGCFHLAAIASVRACEEEWMQSHLVNQSGSVTVLEAARRSGTPVVFASSAAVYGATAAERIAENADTCPSGPYGADKLGTELHARVARMRFGVPTLGLRFFNVYGPRQDGRSPYSGVISIFRERLLARQALRIEGDGGQTRDFVHVADAVAALRAGMAALVAGRDLPPVLNTCSGRATSIAALAALVGSITGRAPRIERAPPRPGDVRHSCGDPARLARHLGVCAAVPLAAGLRQTFGVTGALLAAD